MSVVDDTPVRCAAFARAESLLPAGTAGSLRAVAAVELPLPWPREVTDHPDLAGAAAALADAGVRVQALLPSSVDRGTRRFLTFTRPAGAFAAYEAAAWDVPAGDLSDALAALAASIGPASAPDGPTVPAALIAGPARSVDRGAGAERHVLVCTHGARDACCGALGTRLAAALPDLGRGVPVWRTSHTGGHRFAPTALILPEGTAWAYLDVEALAGIVDRTLAPEAAATHYRGCAGLDGPEVQAADGAALAALGWSWLDRARRAEVVSRDGAGAVVRLVGTSPAGAVTVEVEVATARSVPVPDCGRPLEEARKSAPELVARRVDLV